MKTNNIKNEIELHKRIEKLEVENELLEEKVSDFLKFIKILDAWFQDTEEEELENKDIDCGTYEL